MVLVQDGQTNKAGNYSLFTPMASLALFQSRNALRAPLFSFPALVPSLASVFEDLFPRILLAVPKKKTSHSRKAMRAANKGLKDKHSVFYLVFCLRRLTCYVFQTS
jgi:hypothetical protein